MDKQLLYKLVEETRLQCQFARFAFQNIRANLNALGPENVFFYVDAFLAHASNISGLLWPERAGSQVRGERLRGELKLDEHSPLRLREIKTQLQRFDERVEDWLSPMENRNSLDMNLMPQAALGGITGSDKFHRSLDPDTFRFELRGNVCELRPVYDEIARLETTIQLWFKTNNPW